MAKGYKLVITHFLGFLAKYKYSASASPRSHIVFCLQPSVVGYNYFIHVVMDVSPDADTAQLSLVCGPSCTQTKWLALGLIIHDCIGCACMVYI